MTIYDIAKIAGVSASTVSRVVNKKPGIKDETRQRIQQLLEEYGYTPNETARGLVNRSSRMIGILIEDIRYSHHVEIAYHIKTKLQENGYSGYLQHRLYGRKEGGVHPASGAETGGRGGELHRADVSKKTQEAGICAA